MKSTSLEALTSELGLSLLIHLLLIGVAFLKISIFSSEPLEVHPVVRVDIIDLPDKVMPQAPPAPVEKATPAPPPEKAAPQPATKEGAKVKDNAKVIKNTQKSALEQIKALEAIENQVQSESRAAKPGAKPPTYKGQTLSAGTELTGVERLQNEDYLAELETQVKRQWILPQWLKGSNLTAQVHVLIDAHGNVVKKEIALSSNNPMYDEKVLEAIDRASPFPKPPDKLIRRLENEGVDFSFP